MTVTLVDLLRVRFKVLPEKVEQVIETTQDAEQLAKWLRAVITAKDLASIGIAPQR